MFHGTTKEMGMAQPPWAGSHQLLSFRNLMVFQFECVLLGTSGTGECFRRCLDFVSALWPLLPLLAIRNSPETLAMVRSTVCIIYLQLA